ncbi:MAG: OmpA family protein, partial [Alphaproteobacteria bacterium]|nr:OmpA family protein [Alphaproteobacteria bacterium]
RRLLTPPPIDDLSKAPGFAPLPLPAPIAPPVAEVPPVAAGQAQDFNAVPPPRLSELAPPSRRTAFVPPVSGSQDFSTDIAFAGGSRSLPGDAMPALSAIADRMKSNPGLQARVSGAAAAGDPGEARDVALARALAVQRYLLSRGVMSDAIKVQPVTGGQGRDGVSVTLVVPA